MASVLSGMASSLTLVGTVSIAFGCVRPGQRALPEPGAGVELVVPLTTVADPTPAQGRGMTNLFFEPLSAALRDSVRTPSAWTDLGTDLLVGARQVAPVRALRFRVAGDTAWRFSVDTVGDLDFTTAPILSFVRRGRLQVAELDLAVRAPGGATRRVPYEVLRSDDGYTYGRIAEYRTGLIELNGKRIPLRVSSVSRGHPLFDLVGGTTFLVDLDGDGTLSDRATVTVAGRPASAEQVRGGTAFELNDTFYQLAAIDPSGSELRIRPAPGKGAVGVNLPATEVKARRMDGREFRLSKQRGKVVLLTFWATDCAPSASVRAPLNALTTTYGPELIWAAMAKDTSLVEINAYLKKAPMLGTVLQSEATTWLKYNPDGATPVFAIVDAKGLLRFHATGASSIAAVTAKLDELLGSKR